MVPISARSPPPRPPVKPGLASKYTGYRAEKVARRVLATSQESIFSSSSPPPPSFAPSPSLLLLLQEGNWQELRTALGKHRQSGTPPSKQTPILARHSIASAHYAATWEAGLAGPERAGRAQARRGQETSPPPPSASGPVRIPKAAEHGQAGGRWHWGGGVRGGIAPPPRLTPSRLSGVTGSRRRLLPRGLAPPLATPAQ